jgi:hypothetical protein
MDLLATTALLARLDELQVELTRIERQQTETTPHSDQALLDDAWDTLVEEIEELQEILMVDEANALIDLRGCEMCSGCAYCDDAMGYDPVGEI